MIFVIKKYGAVVQMTTAIWWIRRDLRLADNQTLTAALLYADQVVPVFIFDPTLWNSPYVGEKRVAFCVARRSAASLKRRSNDIFGILRRGCMQRPGTEIAV